MVSALVYGGSGSLGAIVVKRFKDAGYDVVSVDLRPSDQTQYSVVIKGDGSLNDAQEVVNKIKGWNLVIDAVICVAGGFNLASIKDDAIFSALDTMLAFNLKSAVATGYVASHTMKEGGLVVFTGAAAALGPTPGILSYGLSKIATHHLVSSLAQENSGLPKGSKVVAILPVTLDTPQNRKDMPDANFDDWTPLEDVAQSILDWSQGKGTPANGDFIKIQTAAKKTTLTKAN
eukprot:TRINITY_DN11956_c0_g1_i1.p1 TRINITY_DN11956_c0_g1~~TRINITY_DN11956_c0_g1_i1.p1  ORF type:complete len:232 (-),score=87.20 TRINITY_DN11956_c0_g1_i1:80-775(-)